jgi:hypothetical protein
VSTDYLDLVARLAPAVGDPFPALRLTGGSPFDALGLGGRWGSGDPFPGLQVSGGGDPFRNVSLTGGLAGLGDIFTGPLFRRREPPKQDSALKKPAPPSGQYSGVFQGLPAEAAQLGGQITEMARAQYGDAAAPVVAAILMAEGGLSGGIGDRNQHALGSRGPFQFHPGGQLANFARDHGVDLATAATMVDQNPMAAAQWALRTYLGQALRQGMAQGLSGQDLLNRVLAVQNPGALTSAPHYDRYAGYLRHAQQATPAQVQQAWGGTGPAQWQVSFDYGARYSHPWAGGPTHHRGVDLVIPGAPRGGVGTPYGAFRGGRVVHAGPTTAGPGGIGVLLDVGNGQFDWYFHNQRVLVQVGQHVQPGEAIAVVGESGTEGSPHVHYEIRQGHGDGPSIDPRPYVPGLRR